MVDEERSDDSQQDESEPQSSRPTADLIYERVRENAADELARQPNSLAFSAFFSGFTMGMSSLAVALVLALVDAGNEKFIALLFYPAGYIAVIIGRAQLFTENTLYPVVTSLEDRSAIPRTARLWAIVLAGNLAGGLVFAALAVETGMLDDPVVAELSRLGEQAIAESGGTTFWGAVAAGWLLALVAWLVEAGETAVGQILLIYVATLVVGLAGFAHSVASAIAVMAATIETKVGIGEALGWEGLAILGNVIGGVFIVAVLNYGQVHRSGAEE